MHRAENNSSFAKDASLFEACQRNVQFADWKIALQTGNDDPDQAAKAFEQLFLKNWDVVNKYVRWRGYNFHEAEDLTQAFFVHLLQYNAFKKADPSKGQFRSFLYGTLHNFLCNEW